MKYLCILECQSEQEMTQDDPDSPSDLGQPKGHQRSKSLGDPRKMAKQCKYQTARFYVKSINEGAYGLNKSQTF